MKSLLDGHPAIAMIPFETHLLTRWRRRYGMDLSDPETFEAFWSAVMADRRLDHEDLPKELVLGCLRSRDNISMADVLECMLSIYAASVGGCRAGEKTPNHYKHIQRLLSWFPTCQVIFMIRDPRAVLASWRDWEQAWTDKPPAAIIRNWRRSVYEMERWSDHSAVLGVRYEDLVARPEDEVERVLSFLGLDFAQGILERHGSGRLHGKYDLHGPVASGSVERWRDSLSPDQVAWVEQEVGAEMKRLGYQTSRPVPTSKGWVSQTRHALWKARAIADRFRGA